MGQQRCFANGTAVRKAHHYHAGEAASGFDTLLFQLSSY